VRDLASLVEVSRSPPKLGHKSGERLGTAPSTASRNHISRNVTQKFVNKINTRVGAEIRPPDQNQLPKSGF